MDYHQVADVVPEIRLGIFCPSLLDRVEQFARRSIGSRVHANLYPVLMGLDNTFQLLFADGHFSISAGIVGIRLHQQRRLAQRRTIRPVFEANLD